MDQPEPHHLFNKIILIIDYDLPTDFLPYEHYAIGYYRDTSQYVHRTCVKKFPNAALHVPVPNNNFLCTLCTGCPSKERQSKRIVQRYTFAQWRSVTAWNGFKETNKNLEMFGFQNIVDWNSFAQHNFNSHSLKVLVQSLKFIGSFERWICAL